MTASLHLCSVHLPRLSWIKPPYNIESLRLHLIIDAGGIYMHYIANKYWFCIAGLTFEAGLQLLLDRNVSSCHVVTMEIAVTFMMDTSSTEFAGLRPVHIAAHLQQDGSCNGLTMVYTKSLNPGCRRYKKCRLLSSSSVDKQCIFECHCDENTCVYGLISSQHSVAGTNVCELYVVW